MIYKIGMLCKHFKGENLLEKNIYRIEITKKSGIYDKYLRKCIHIAKQVPFYRLKRPIGRLSVKEQIDIIKSIGVV